MSFDAPDENAAFAQKYAFNFPLLCDTDRKVGLSYGATDPGETKGARRIGVVIGPDGTIRHHLPKVDARAFPQQALELIEPA